MFEWLIDNSGTISAVLGGLATVGGIICLSIYSSVAIPVAVGISIVVVAGVSIISGVSYLSREHGVRRERERQQTRIEADRQRAVERERLNAAENDLLAANGPGMTQAVNETRENREILALRAMLNTHERRIASLEGNQATLSQNQALREIHQTRRSHAARDNSDSDSEDQNLLSTSSIFANRQRPAANVPSLGVEIRQRKNR